MITPRTPLFLVAAFSPEGRVFRAFDHLIAAGIGEMLLCPVHLAEGDLRGVIDYCPVPWEEAWAVLDTPLDGAAAIDCETMSSQWPRLARLHRSGWLADSIGLGNSVAQTKSIDRITHASGLRFVRIHAVRHG